MNTCPKCGSPQASELTLSGFALRKAMWFGCGSHVLLDEPEQIVSRSQQCCDQQEINDLRRKVEELCVLRKECDQWRCISASLLVYAESLLRRIPDRSEINWTVLEQARAMFKEESK